MRKAFTLLELLAVIAIITLLIGILLPAVQGVREAGKRTQCINHQRNLAVALLTYDNTKGALPGWRDLITMQRGQNKVAAHASWIFCILPHIEQTSLYDQLKGGFLNVDSNAEVIPMISLLHCPSLMDPPQARGTNYVVNGGGVDDYFSSLGNEVVNLDEKDPYTVDGNIANGPFLDRARIMAYNSGGGEYQEPYFKPEYRHAVVSGSEISKRDGTAHTLLTSENCQRGFWIAKQYTHFYHIRQADGVVKSVELADVKNNYPELPDGRVCPIFGAHSASESEEDYAAIEGSVAFCWPRSVAGSTIAYPEKDGNFYQGFSGVDKNTPDILAFEPLERTTVDINRAPVFLNQFNKKIFGMYWMRSARPSSMHVGVVIASFCDGNVRRINTEMNEVTFVQLMTVSDAQSDAGKAITGGNFLQGQLFDAGVL